MKSLCTILVLSILSISGNLEDFESGDFGQFPWQQGGNKPWLITGLQSNNGNYSAHSGAVGNNEHSELSLTLNISEPGEISFAKRVSSESGWDFLRFYIDGALIDSWSGELPWEEVNYPVSAGLHTFSWRYEKDELNSGGNDRAWLDDIQFPPYRIAVNTQEIPTQTPALTLSPNPGKGVYQLNLDFERKEDLDMKVFSLSGDQITRFTVAEGQRQVQIDLSDQAPGTYILQTTWNNQTIVERLVKY